MTKSTFQERIKNLRNEKKLTMDELARELGVTKSRVNMWENAGSVPKEDILIKISKFFSVSVDYLLGNEIMEGKNYQNKDLEVLQRGLEKLDKDKLTKAKDVLSAVFDDLFEEEEEFGDL